MRRRIIAGNWKMNKNHDDAKESFMHLNTWVRINKPKSKVIIAPSALYLGELEALFNDSAVKIASQDVSSEESGAYTGEISAEQLQSIGIEYCIVGHSERRRHHEDNNFTVWQKVGILYKYGMRPILCVGELLEERESGKHFDIVKEQVFESIKGVSDENLKKLIIAYEPVWAIGTGKTASPSQAQEMHHFIRNEIAKAYNVDVADEVRILYGGSMNAGNARDLFNQPDIDGGLVGGASLNYEDFQTIINAAG